MYTYIADSAGVLTGPAELPVTPGLGIQVPSNAFQLAIELAQPAAGCVWVLVDGKPQQLADHRGTVYSAVTGAAEQHTELGELPEGLTTEQRPTADHSWTGSSWAFDASKQATNRLALSVSLCETVDAAADAARLKVAGDPLRATEYERAAIEAQAFKDAGYPAESVPRTVAAWAINSRTAEQAADSILAESAAYTEALYCLREVRLNGKEQVRAAMDAGNVELAQQITEQTIAKINTDIAGVGNNPS
ncbi:hypothetical protein [Pseudomonas marincola]|uniref:hypothetical protein n=1 Tax=Pseudomonas marincola TaxID=437900 RepID=UPI0008ED3047|nr:hypothetical protein [Pseudomonas marincola]SFT49137.1 hypothetical protein SAMN05216264_101597 [Pseudomonas marincola]